MSSLNVTQNLAGKEILLYGGTGFLGKVFLSLLLTHFSDIKKIHLVVRARRDRDGNVTTSSQSRFLKDIVTSQAFDPVREKHPGTQYNTFINEKIHVVDGDVTKPFAGISDAVREKIRGAVDILINTSGVVDFNPPLDKSLDVNAFGMQNLVSLAKDLGSIPFMHTSTCYVAGDQTGQVNEINPLDFPFPKADTLSPEHWDSEREIKECMEMTKNTPNDKPPNDRARINGN